MENSLLLFLGYVIEGIIILYYSKGLFQPRCEMKRNYYHLILLYSILFFASLLELPLLNLILFTLFNYIYFYFLFSVSWYGAAFHTSIFTGFMSTAEYITLTFFKFLSPTFMNDEPSFSTLFLFAFVNKLIFYISIYLLKFSIAKWNKNNVQRDKSSLLLLLFPLSSSIILGVICLPSLGATFNPIQNIILTISCLLLLASYLLIFVANQHNQEKHEELTALKLQLQKDEDLAMYYQMLDEQNENQRILIHDIKKHLQSISFLNDNNESTKISAYIDQLLQSSELKDSLKLCDHPILNSILCRYLKQAQETSLSFHVDIRKNTTYFLEDRDLTALFCNLLDNAFAATSLVPEGYIEVFVSRQPNTPFVTLTLINSCRKNPFSPDGRRLLPCKEKEGYHGFGIKSVEKVVKKYHGEMKMYYDDETKTFHTILYMKTGKN